MPYMVPDDGVCETFQSEGTGHKTLISTSGTVYVSKTIDLAG